MISIEWKTITDDRHLESKRIRLGTTGVFKVCLDSYATSGWHLSVWACDDAEYEEDAQEACILWLKFDTKEDAEERALIFLTRLKRLLTEK